MCGSRRLQALRSCGDFLQAWSKLTLNNRAGPLPPNAVIRSSGSDRRRLHRGIAWDRRSWRATTDDDDHYVYAIALDGCGAGSFRRQIIENLAALGTVGVRSGGNCQFDKDCECRLSYTSSAFREKSEQAGFAPML